MYADILHSRARMLIYLAIMLIPLIGLCGLVVDVGRIEARSLQLQTAADDAAIAYALESGRRGSTASTSQFTTMANSELAAWATANNLAAPTLTLQSGASTGPYASNNNVVQATVQQTMSTMMLGILSSGNKSIQLSRTAVAAMPPCATVYTTLSVSTSSNLILNCPVAAGTSLTIDGLSRVSGSTLVAGGASASTVAGLVSPTPIYGWPSETHPDSYATYTTGGSCVATNLNINNNVAAILTPGMYCNSTTITNSIVTMQPGFYTMQGGMTVTNSTILGGPAQIVVEKNSSNAGQFILSTAIWSVSASTTSYGSGLPAILVACVVPVGTTNTWGSTDIQIINTTITSDGIISCGLVGAALSGSTISSAGHYFSFVFAKATISGTTLTTANDYSQLPGGSPHAYTVNIIQ